MWTTDTFLQNLVRFSVLKGQGQDRPTAVVTDPRPSGRTHSRRERPTAVGKDPRPSGKTHGRREDPRPLDRLLMQTYTLINISNIIHSTLP